MKERYQLSGWQMFVVIFLTSFCMTPFSFESLHITWGRHMWVPALAQLLVTLTGGLGVTVLWRRFPGRSFKSLAVDALGPFFGRILLVGLAAYLYMWGPVGNESVLARLINASELPRTDPMLITALMTAAVVYAAWFGSEVIGRVGEVWGLVLLPLIVAVIVISYSGATPTHLLPLTGIPWSQIREAYFWSFALGARGFILALAFMGMLRPGENPTRPVLAGSLTAQLLITGMVLLPHATFSGPTIKKAKFQFPVLEALDTINLSAIGLQSFLSVTLAAWYIVSWIVVAASLFGAAYLLAEAFGIASHRWVLLILTFPGVLLSLVPMVPDQRIVFTNLWSGLGYGVGVLAPWLLLALGRPQKQGSPTAAEDELPGAVKT